MNAQNTLFEPLVWFIYLAIPLTLVCGLVFVEGQQILRTDLNDPQTQMAQDIAAALKVGASPSEVVPEAQVDAAASLDPFIIVYDAQGRPLAGNGFLDAKLFGPPPGVFQNAVWWSEGHTWQPEPTVRIAAVIEPYISGGSSGYVLAGRNMREVEKREEQHLVRTFLAWVVIMFATFVASFAAWWVLKK